jgi:hypothetical protein
MKISETFRLFLNRTILRNLFLIICLSVLLLTFPFRGVWSQGGFVSDYQILMATSCDRTSNANFPLFPPLTSQWSAHQTLLVSIRVKAPAS